jgi:predicted DNA-binding transcriptional regulator YafY
VAATANVLGLLELLESRPAVTAAQAAAELGVDPRTVRRYVASLQSLGIPVEGERGVGGGYRLAPGFRLPPLMLAEGEAAVVALGLAAVRRLGLGEPGDVDAAVAKVRRVLPRALRGRVEALDAALDFTAAPREADVPGERLLLLADAIARRRRVTLRYRAADGEESDREISPHGLVAHGGHWYLVGHDHGRDAPRTLRADRVLHAALGAAADPAPDGFDAAAAVTEAFARLPWRHEVEVVLDLPLEDARTRAGASLAVLGAEGDRTRMLLRADSLDWAASFLAGLGCAFEVRRPDELREALARLAGRLRAA